jgi:hydrogenase maturation protease
LNRILVLGIGNLLMGDEAVGVEAVRALQGTPLPPGVTLLDGGTGSFQLLSWLAGQDAVVLIDASADEKPPGTVSLLEPRFASDFPRSLTAHDIGLRDLIEAASLLGALPRVFLVTVSVTEFQSMRIGLSDAVAASLPRVVEQVRSLLDGLTARVPEAVASG